MALIVFISVRSVFKLNLVAEIKNYVVSFRKLLKNLFRHVNVQV